MSLEDPVVVFGHRGAAGLAPENTLPSFRRAVECGVNAVELDVHVLEGALVVIHDDTVDRTTDGSGTLARLGLAGLRALDAGAGARVPLLEEVVGELPAHVGLNVELKGPGTAAPLAAFLARHPGLDVVVSSFDHALLRAFRQLDGRTRVAPLVSRWQSGVWQVARELDAWSLHFSRRAANARRLAHAAELGLRRFVYTVNDLAEARRLLSLGADGVFTDYPDRITPAALADPAPASDGSARR
jgi:glycerophosphoryl diester phosphodiesterase